MTDGETPLIVAVDGGGTTCRAAIAAPDGRILGRAEGSSANATTDFDGAHLSLMACVAAAYGDAALDPARHRRDFAYMGLAGANVSDTAARMAARLEFRAARVTSDREITVEGALGPGPGAVALMGTGSFFVCRAPGGAVRSVGGWGFQLGDDLSGAWLGRKLLRRVILAHDGLAEASEVTAAVLARFGGHPDGMVAFAQGAAPRDYARFAPMIVEGYGAGDAAASEIGAEARDGLVAMLDRIGAGDAGGLCLLGGLGPFYAGLLPERYNAMCRAALGDGIDGAISMARAAFAPELA